MTYFQTIYGSKYDELNKTVKDGANIKILVSFMPVYINYFTDLE
ncbi:MAG: hypothetical protein U0W24_06335 [Bacteroidales bacterium]